MKEAVMEQYQNPVINSDFPDPDIIRVGDAYYMASTTMYLMPGGDILRSRDLVHWEFLCHVFSQLEDNPAHCLEDGQQIYGLGMWAPSLRFHKGTFYLTFACNDTHKSLLFLAQDPAGPWRRVEMGGFSMIGGTMPRMSKKRKLELSFFLNDRERLAYNDLCRKCQHECKQSFRAVVIDCPHYLSKRAKRKEKTD